MARNSTKLKAVILAGGSGERFWPLSTPERPKQFLTLFGGKTLLRQSVERLRGLVEAKDVFVVTAKSLVEATRKELPEVPAENILGEECRRDTAAAVTMGVAAAGEGTIGVFPADQLVEKPGAFRTAVKKAAAIAEKEPAIVTLGIKPSYAATGFGYVDPKSGKFAEKPDEKTARKYIKAGYLWNAGIFIARYGTFKAAVEAKAPELKRIFELKGEARKIYKTLPKISFDYAVMEKWGQVRTVEAVCGWDDVGSYLSAEKHLSGLTDKNGNLVISGGRTVKVVGLMNLVVACSDAGVLVMDRKLAGELKKFL